MIVSTTGCGLSYAVRRRRGPVAYCALSTRGGTRSEGEYPEGIAHFLEHTIFKGTDRRTAEQISSCLDHLGGELNAYTTKEEIVLHATVLREDVWKAVSLLLELATRSTFPDEAVQTERGVVLDEIQSYKDSPADDVYDTFEEMFFDGHPLGRKILGTLRSVRSITPQQLRDFARQVFDPRNIVITIVADLPEGKMAERVGKMVAEVFGTAPAAEEAPAAVTGLPRPESHIFDITREKRNHEANAVFGGVAPGLYDTPDRICAVLLANILGGPGSNSLLNRELREKHGWVYGVECGYTQYSDTGIMTVSLGCERENLEKCFDASRRIIDGLIQKPIGEARLKAAKKQLLGQLAISGDNGESQCLSMGKSMMAFGRVAGDAENKALIEAVTAADLQAMARRIFAPDKISKLVFL